MSRRRVPRAAMAGMRLQAQRVHGHRSLAGFAGAVAGAGLGACWRAAYMPLQECLALLPPIELSRACRERLWQERPGRVQAAAQRGDRELRGAHCRAAPESWAALWSQAAGMAASPGMWLSAIVTAIVGSAGGLHGLIAAVLVAFCGLLGAAFGDKTRAGRALTGPVCAMAVGVAAAQIVQIPDTTLRLLQRTVITLASPLLLGACDLREVFAGGAMRRLLAAFGLGAFGTMLGGLLGACALHRLLVDACGGEYNGAAAIVSALTAKNIGSGLNFMAVVEALQPQPSLVAAALAADNALGLLYFPLASGLTPREAHGAALEARGTPAVVASNAGGQTSSSAAVASTCSTHGKWRGVASTLFVGLAVAAAAEVVAPKGFALLLSTVFAVALASVPRVSRHCPAGELLGWPLLYLYFASAGFAAGTSAPPGGLATYGPLMLFGLLLYATHFAVILLGGRLAGFGQTELMVASSANIGGPATASSLAMAKGRRDLARPALLVGTLGNAVGTCLGLLLYRILLTIRVSAA